MAIWKSAQTYEAWLRAQLKGDVDDNALLDKHQAMCAGPFPFLRGTYWRWAETVLDICKDLADAPVVPAVGDIHLENFGTWRDAEGRLVWGVNDFDEAAEMPWVLDIVRLATSTVLADVRGFDTNDICEAILAGYAAGLGTPGPILLDIREDWLRGRFEVKKRKREKFWHKYDPDAHRGISIDRKDARKFGRPSTAFLAAFEAALPNRTTDVLFWPHAAGLGSRGRPRWIAYGEWRGGPIVREAKAVVRSAWSLAHRGKKCLRIADAARGPYRAPDPWYRLVGCSLVRRLSPNNRKLDLCEVGSPSELVDARMLEAMGRDIAAIHRATGRRADLEGDLHRRGHKAIMAATDKMAAFVRAEHADWLAACRRHARALPDGSPYAR
jgi:hypothetical protein